ncbi:FGFR1 oncogene partner isoform X3 [Lates calcarifer]|uniref:Centrosomal protein 43 n=1 Tax=Lates calcarifer TaxID=8187 RepID=A0AAJ7Q1I0_LATCA|nr:FGFR1 oncogene partner isoform X3 [Lates calcarifer]
MFADKTHEEEAGGGSSSSSRRRRGLFSSVVLTAAAVSFTQTQNMSATEDDTELRDLLIQNLENSGVLNKLKAEMRAAVFLAMEEQDKENKSPLINEKLKTCLNTKDGRLVASLIVDFLQVFNLDFTLAVFQPEINSLNGLDGRDLVCRDLGLSESEVNRNSPLLLELIRRGRHREKQTAGSEGDRTIPKEPSQKQIISAQKKFDLYDKDRSGSVLKEDLKSVFTDLFPGLNKNMLERFISDELRAADKTFSTVIEFQVFLGMYKRLFAQCRSVVVQDSDVGRPQGPSPEERTSSPPVSKIPRFKGQRHRGQSQTAAQDSDRASSLGKGDFQQQASDSRTSSFGLKRERLDLDLEVEDDLDDGDSFFDDPLPKPQKTYGCRSSPFGEKDSSERTDSQRDVVPLREECLSGPVVSPMRRGKSLNDLSVLACDSEGERDDRLSEHGQSSELRKVEASGARESPAGSLPEAPRPGGGGRAGGGGSSTSEQSHSRNGEKGFRDSKALNDKTGSLHLDDDVEYDDDFNSHRSDFSKSELSIGEEIEEVSIEGPDNSDKVIRPEPGSFTVPSSASE